MLSRYIPTLLSLAAAFTPMAAQQPNHPFTAATPCILHDGKQNCSEPGLKQTIAAANSVAVESGPRDSVGTKELRDLVTKLDKSLALDAQSADIALKLSPIEQSGVMYGASDRELARLEVFAPVGPASRPQLIWTETLSGPADLTWPAAVARLLDQFRHRVKEH